MRYFPFAIPSAIIMPNFRQVCHDSIPKICVLSDCVLLKYDTREKTKKRSCLCCNLCEVLQIFINEREYFYGL